MRKDDQELDDIDAILERRLADTESRLTERIANTGGQDDGASEKAVQERGAAYRAEVQAAHTPASLRIRWLADLSVIEIEPAVSGAPFQSGALRIAADKEFLESVSLSHRLDDDASKDVVAATLTDIEERLSEALPDDLAGEFADLEDTAPLVLRVDAELLDIPWEVAHVPRDHGTRLMDRYHTGRAAIAQGQAARTHPRLARDKLSMLVLGDPDRTLGKAGVDDTLDFLENVLQGEYSDTVSYAIYRGPITKALALSVLGRGGHDVVFYMGHGCLSPASGFAFAGEGEDRVLTAREISHVLMRTEPPRIWLADACLSARMPRVEGEASPLGSMVLALAAQGVHYIGTSWSIRTPTAVGFAIGFLHNMLAGAPLGECVSMARSFCYNEWAGHIQRDMSSDPDPLAFVLYGDPSTRVVID